VIISEIMNLFEN